MNLFFIDDSGSKQWNTPYARTFIDNPPARTKINREFWQTNYFVLAGIHINSQSMSFINKDINQKKLELFKDKNVEIKSNYLRNPFICKIKYLKQYSVKIEDLRRFIDDFWYQLLIKYQSDIQIQAVVLDKRYYNEQRHRRSPLDIATVTLLDRIEKHPQKRCRIIFDQMESSIKSTKGDQGRILQIANKSIDLGSKQKGNYSHLDIKFERSVTSNLLQLADTVAYNIWRQFVDFGPMDIATNLEFKEYYPYFNRIQDNFYKKANGDIHGYGLVTLPTSKIFNKQK